MFFFLYTDESSLPVGDNCTIPQTAATERSDHVSKPEVDMVKKDPRDDIYKSEWLLS